MPSARPARRRRLTGRAGAWRVRVLARLVSRARLLDELAAASPAVIDALAARARRYGDRA